MARANTAAVKQLIAQLPEKLRENVLQGAARAAGRVVAAEAKRLCISELVRDGIRVTTEQKGTKIIARVQCRGKGAFLAPWLEYGTQRHIIRFRGDAPAGRSLPTVAQWNRMGRTLGTYQGQRKGSLRIGNRWVGNAVIHPGAKRHPFMRVALDTQQQAAFAGAQAFINRRLTPAGLSTPDAGDDEQ